MGSDLYNALRSLCSNTIWNYAIFWKLKYCSPMVLTWEDAYYDNCIRRNAGGFESSLGEHAQTDYLGMTVAKMTYLVYSLGEGIVGQVAATGKHRWIFGDSLLNNVQYFEPSDEALSQFSAGIRTLVVVGVVPFGVVQLGSFDKVAEDMKFVYLVREVFLTLQNSNRHILSQSYSLDTDFHPISNRIKIGSPFSESTQNQRLSQLNLNASRLVDEKPIITNLNPQISERNTNSDKDMNSSYQTKHEDDVGTDPSKVLEPCTASSYLSDLLEEAECSSLILPMDTKKQIDFEAQSFQSDDRFDTPIFSGGYELHEALGPEFLKKYVLCSNDSKSSQLEPSLNNPVPDKSSRSTLGSDTASEKSVCKSKSPLLISENVQNLNTIKIYCGNEDTQEFSISTDMVVGISTTGFSTCESMKNKKRARPGESSRPRPRDRQLIQDRIKELRELVPNGSKCSIDSLLERTIKHMLFLECITKHADKLNKFDESKIQQKGTCLPSSSHGSRWVVEVGGHFKVSSIAVENLNKTGQVLVKLLCEECCHFLEIAEAIRGLGLTILKGVTEVQGDKTWICFVVEAQNNQIMHMDILCSLVQVLQPKTSN